MTTRYVDGTNGNNAWNGLAATWDGANGPKATLTGAEDSPVAAGDTVWVRPGVYRETLTCDVSGSDGSPITYVGDVVGEIWGVGGIVRVTGSDDDESETRANCITAAAKNYRTFRGFSCDTTTNNVINGTSGCTDWIIEDCTVFGGGVDCVVCGGTGARWTIRRGIFLNRVGDCIKFTHSSTVDNASHLVENCLIITPATSYGIRSARIGGITVRNCTMLFCGFGAGIGTAISAGQTFTVKNSIFQYCSTALIGQAAGGSVIEDFKILYRNGTNRSNCGTGANSKTVPALFMPPLLYAGTGQVGGYRLPWWFGELSPWSQVREGDAVSIPETDFFGRPRPTLGIYGETDSSWGAFEYQDVQRATNLAHGGATSMVMADAARYQRLVPVGDVSTTISAWVYREADYSGPNPRMIIKQPGQTDRVVVDAGPVGQWNQISVTFTPAATPGWLVVELVSLNQTEASVYAGNYDVYWDDLTVS